MSLTKLKHANYIISTHSITMYHVTAIHWRAATSLALIAGVLPPITAVLSRTTSRTWLPFTAPSDIGIGYCTALALLATVCCSR